MYDTAGQFLDSIYYQEIGKREEREIVNIHDVHLFMTSGVI